MKIAVISDIHGNLEALKSVLDDIKKENCDKIFCLGDLAMAGPQPNETIDFLRNLENVELIQGNTDLMIAESKSETFDILNKSIPVMANAFDSDIKTVSEKQKTYLKNLPSQKEIKLGDLKILLVHGSPRRNNEDIMPDLDIKKVEEMIASTNADIIFCGHTHKPCGYQTTTNQTVINVGSVGRPFSENPDSCYCIIEFNENGGKEFLAKHNFVKYDFEKSAQILSKRGFVGADKLADMLRHATNRYPR